MAAGCLQQRGTDVPGVAACLRACPMCLLKCTPPAGAGVGKGRQIAALIKQHWAEGGRRALWVSVSSDLRHDAARDLADVKATHIPVCPKVGAVVVSLPA